MAPRVVKKSAEQQNTCVQAARPPSGYELRADIHRDVKWCTVRGGEREGAYLRLHQVEGLTHPLSLSRRPPTNGTDQGLSYYLSHSIHVPIEVERAVETRCQKSCGEGWKTRLRLLEGSQSRSHHCAVPSQRSLSSGVYNRAEIVETTMRTEAKSDSVFEFSRPLAAGWIGFISTGIVFTLDSNGASQVPPPARSRRPSTPGSSRSHFLPRVRQRCPRH